MMPLHLDTLTPLEDLKRNPCAFREIFSEEKDFNVIFVKEIPEHNILIFEKRYNGIGEIAIVICVDDKVTKITLKQLMNHYKKIVLSLPGRNFREVEPVVIAKEFDNDVLTMIERYNSSYEKRKPFRLFTYG